MAEYVGSIDDEVQRKVDAYRNNPGVLQQRYQMNQDLLDLLALQRINKEMQEKKRDIEMSMQQNPQTIKQQREAEVLGMTKNELGRQVGGIMAQRQAAQQQNLQRVAAGQQPATRMPMNPQMAGIASQPAPNMARMAQGGVVAFAKGDPVEGESEEDRRKREATKILAEVGYTPEKFNALNDAAKQRVLNTINSRRSNIRPGLLDQAGAFVGDVLSSPVRSAVGLSADLLRTIGVMDPATRGYMELDPYLFTKQTAALRADPNLQPVVMSQLLPLVAPTTPPTTPPPPAPAPAPAPIPVPPPPPPPPPQLPAPATAAAQMAGITAAMPAGQRAEYRDPTKTPEGIALAKDRARILGRTEQSMNRDSMAERAARETGVGSLLRRDERRAMYDKLMADREALNRRQTEERARRGPLADLLASPRAGSSAFGRIGQDLYRAEERRFAQERADLDYLYKMAQEREKADIEAGKAQVVAGTEAQRFAEADIQTARKDAQSLLSDRSKELSDVAKGYLAADTANMTAEAAERSDRVKMAISQADNVVKTDIANLEAKIQTERNRIEREKFAEMNATRKQELIGTVINMVGKLRAGYDELMQKAIYDRVFMRGLKGDKAQAEETRIRKQYEALRNASVAELIKFRDDIAASLSGGIEGFTVKR